MTVVVARRVIEPVSVSSVTRALATVCGLMTLVAACYGFRPGAVFAVCTLGGLIGLMGLFPIEMAIRTARSASTMASMAVRARAAMVQAIGREPLAIDTGGSLSKERKGLISATGIAWDGERLWVMDSGQLGCFPFSAVREWTWRTQTGAQTRVYGVGLGQPGMTFQVAQENAQANASAFTESGFFVTVADIRRPVWQFMTRDVAVLQRWDEIMRQIGEGRLAAAR